MFTPNFVPVNNKLVFTNTNVLFTTFLQSVICNSDQESDDYKWCKLKSEAFYSEGYGKSNGKIVINFHKPHMAALFGKYLEKKFEEFKEKVSKDKMWYLNSFTRKELQQYKGILRIGQCYMNCLACIDEKLYDEITATEYDCFYNDDLIGKFMTKVYQTWS